VLRQVLVSLTVTDTRGMVTGAGTPDMARAARIILKDYVNVRVYYFSISL
jgi:ribosome biogenesis GTPase A